MSKERRMTLLVGDNPFHGISHLSQERSRDRGDEATSVDYAAKLVMTAVDNGADGFMFSVSDKTLSILRTVRKTGPFGRIRLFPVVPYAYEYVRLATEFGGISGLAKRFARQIAVSGNFKAIGMGLRGLARMDPVALMKTYLTYEVSRIKSATGGKARMDSILLHEVVTDMAIALKWDWIFKSYIDFVLKLGIRPGFETRNFPSLVNAFREWNLDMQKVVLVTAFNKLGFQMNPSRVECEKALECLHEPNVVAMSVLAAGYLKPAEAVEYIADLSNITGLVVGVSKEYHARETFRFLQEKTKNIRV
ncbi:hypothetical protein MUO79_12125 [Candidatus Bathyarchaeota archaeon]|nr:hypothetical protein [Candidatus Bathyarchaeota archaeon]